MAQGKLQKLLLYIKRRLRGDSKVLGLPGDDEAMISEFAFKGAEFMEGFCKAAKHEGRNKYEALEKNKVPLTPEERSIVMKRKAAWHHGHVIPGTGGEREASPAVWKSVGKDGKTQYVTATHRAYNVRPTLQGAISRYHRHIKGTA